MAKTDKAPKASGKGSKGSKGNAASKAPALPAASEPAVAEVSASDEKVLASDIASAVGSPSTSPTAPGAPVGHTAERQKPMAELSMKRNDKARKSLAVVYGLGNQRGSVRFSKTIFADGEGPAEIPGSQDEAGNVTFTIPAGVLASARAPMSKAESRKAYYEKRKNMTVDQKIEAARKKLAKMEADAAKAAAAKQAPAGEPVGASA